MVEHDFILAMYVVLAGTVASAADDGGWVAPNWSADTSVEDALIAQPENDVFGVDRASSVGGGESPPLFNRNLKFFDKHRSKHYWGMFINDDIVIHVHIKPETARNVPGKGLFSFPISRIALMFVAFLVLDGLIGLAGKCGPKRID